MDSIDIAGVSLVNPNAQPDDTVVIGTGPGGNMVVTGSISEADRSFIETWENISSTQNAIIRLDVRGDERPEVISTRRKFMITSQERIITQDRIVDRARDPFTNGAFRPVIVPESVSIDSNPNALSDEEILRIFKASDIAWDEYLKVIDSPETLRRMVDLADQSEEISHKRVRVLQRRLTEVKPVTRIVQKDQEQYDKMAGATTPESTAKRGQGGRSSDYR